MSVIKPSIKTLMQDLLNKPFSLLTDNEKNQLLKNGLITQEKLDRFLKESLLANREILNRNDKGENNQNKKDSNPGSFSLTAYQTPQDQAQKSSTDNKGADEAAKQAAQTQTGAQKKETKEKEKEKLEEIMGINRDDIEYGEYGEGHSSGSHGGDPLGSTTPGEDKRDYGADSLLAWAKQNAKSSEDISLVDRLELTKKGSKEDRDKLDHYTDGQGIAQLGSSGGTGLNERDWFELMRMQGDQFIGLAKAKDPNLSDQAARNQARSLLIGRVQEYTKAGISDGNLIGVLIGKGMTAQQFKDSPEEKARYERYEKAKSGAYDWGAMMSELRSKNIDTGFVENFTGMDQSNANLFTENLFYESYANIDKLSKDLHYFQDKALGFNLIFACDSSKDHNGALHMNHGSLTGLAADDKNPTIVLSPRNDADMMKMIFRLSFIPRKEEHEKDKQISGMPWLDKPLDESEKKLMAMLADNSLSSEEKIKQFNAYLDSHGLEKNIGVANYMLKGHGWGGGIALHDNGTYDNGDKGIMALMGLSISAHVDQARIHQQSCSTAVGGERSNIGVGNDTINDFAPSTTKVVSVGANAIHWNGQGEHYQNVSYIHGNLVNEGQITEKQYYARTGLNDTIRQEEKDALSMWTRNENGITVRKPQETPTNSNQESLLASNN
jgi:hypothetical protein